MRLRHPSTGTYPAQEDVDTEAQRDRANESEDVTCRRHVCQLRIAETGRGVRARAVAREDARGQAGQLLLVMELTDPASNNSYVRHGSSARYAAVGKARPQGLLTL